MKVKVKNNVFWVGKIDWELRKFHGNEYSTHRGSTYNSYLVKEEKIVLIDTVWAPFAKEYVANLEAEIDLNEIDYVIVNHAEIDHSGALPELMAKIPATPIYCTKKAVESITGHYHKDWNFNVVKSGDTLEIGGGKKLIFLEMKMLHWPDSMACYVTDDNILFSNDAFGQHYAQKHLFNDMADKEELFSECIKYYANILAPFSGLVSKKIAEVQELNIPIDIIATSHGVIWRDNPMQIIEKYIEWSQAYQEDQITLLYDTMWNGTKRMAEAIAEGIQQADENVKIKLFNISKTDKNDMVTEVFKSKMILVGSPTINRGITVAAAGLLEEIAGLRFQNKQAASFGSYGWSGEAVTRINERLESAGFELVTQGLKLTWNPNEEQVARCTEFGKELVGKVGIKR